MIDALFYETDFFTLLIAASTMLYIGQFCVKSSSTADTWGKRIASVIFLFLLGSELLTGEFSDPMSIAGMAVSTLLKAGMVLGLSWMILPVPLFLYEQTVWEGWGYLDRKRQEYQRQEKQQQEEQERLEQQRLRDDEWKQNAPIRERQQQEKEQRRLKQIKEQHLREEVRLRCQLLYDYHAHEVQEKLSPERLEDYFCQYLSDDYPAEMVEQRGELLKEMIEQSLEPDTSDQLEFNSIQEIAFYFKKQREEIEQLEYDDITRQTIQAALSTHEDSLIQAFMSRKY